MANERRNNSRMPMAIDAVVNHHACAVICTIKDISVTGAFLEAPPDDLPYSGGQVELALTVTSKGQPKSYRLPAIIRRVTDSGVGVSFNDVNREAYFGLVDLVFPGQASSSAVPAPVQVPVARFEKP
jgi:hypothetical protein